MLNNIWGWIQAVLLCGLLLLSVVLGPLILMAGVGALALMVAYVGIVHDPIKKQPP